MGAYGPPLQEGKRSWFSAAALVVIWGGLLGQWDAEAASVFMGKQEAGPGMCAMICRYIPRDSRAFIPITLPNDYTILCRVNSSASHCNWVLLASRGHSYYFNRDLKDHFIMDHTGLGIIGMKKEMEGEYQVLSGPNRTCEAQVRLTAVGPWFHYRIFLLVPGIAILSALGWLWEWLIKTRNEHIITQVEQSMNDNIQHVIPPS
ncbi:uncharacterized protein LOC143834510 [Paroedura picta]|uniref:uncharacterized protein LOC143834510 n=1 Tax=Paroedura picta TaxID=143630 RepID=UPI004055BBE7